MSGAWNKSPGWLPITVALVHFARCFRCRRLVNGDPLPGRIHVPHPGFDALLANPLITRRFVREPCHVTNVEVGRHLVVRKGRLFQGSIPDGLDFYAEADGFVHVGEYDGACRCVVSRSRVLAR